MVSVKYKASAYGDFKGDSVYLIRNSGVKTLLSYLISNDERALVSLYEMPMVADEGSRINISSCDRNIKDFPPSTISESVSCEDYGFLLHSFLSLGSTSDDGWLLEEDGDYLIVIAKTGGEGAYNISFELEEVIDDVAE